MLGKDSSASSREQRTKLPQKISEWVACHIPSLVAFQDSLVEIIVENVDVRVEKLERIGQRPRHQGQVRSLLDKLIRPER